MQYNADSELNCDISKVKKNGDRWDGFYNEV